MVLGTGFQPQEERAQPPPREQGQASELLAGHSHFLPPHAGLILPSFNSASACLDFPWELAKMVRSTAYLTSPLLVCTLTPAAFQSENNTKAPVV